MTSRASCIRPRAVDVEGDAGAVAGDRLDVGDRQVGAGQDDRVGGPARWPIGARSRCRG